MHSQQIPMFRKYQYITNISSALYSFQLSKFMCYRVDRRHVGTVL